MLYPLEILQSQKVRPLFHALEQNQPMCTSVLERVYPGKIFVDDVEQPRSALLTTSINGESSDVWGFLVGEPANEVFNQALNKAIFQRQVIADDTPIIFMTFEPIKWKEQMETIFSPFPPIWMPRYHFVSRKASYDWRAALPQGFVVEPISNKLLNYPNLGSIEDVADTLAKWHAMTHPHFMDFGFVVIDQTGEHPVIASQASVDFIANGAGDLGFFTQSDYRRRGLGTIAVAAVLEYGFANGLKQINWTCDAENQASFRTAEKLGLERIDDYLMTVLLLDEKQHMAYVNS